MKLLNFSNVEFRWEEEKEIRFNEWIIVLYYKCKYWFYHPSSFYFRIDLENEDWRYNLYRFKLLKKGIEDETS